MSIVKELSIYKNPERKFNLVRYESMTGQHLRLWFKSEYSLQYDDLIWAESDLQKENRKTILVVEHSYPVHDDIQSYRVRIADGSLVKKLRKFEPGEDFLLIASFREVKDDRTRINI